MRTDLMQFNLILQVGGHWEQQVARTPTAERLQGEAPSSNIMKTFTKFRWDTSIARVPELAWWGAGCTWPTPPTSPTSCSRWWPPPSPDTSRWGTLQTLDSNSQILHVQVSFAWQFWRGSDKDGSMGNIWCFVLSFAFSHLCSVLKIFDSTSSVLSIDMLIPRYWATGALQPGCRWLSQNIDPWARLVRAVMGHGSHQRMAVAHNLCKH